MVSPREWWNAWIEDLGPPEPSDGSPLIVPGFHVYWVPFKMLQHVPRKAFDAIARVRKYTGPICFHAAVLVDPAITVVVEPLRYGESEVRRGYAADLYMDDEFVSGLHGNLHEVHAFLRRLPLPPGILLKAAVQNQRYLRGSNNPND